MSHSHKIGSKPAYFDGQLLLAANFIDEQRFHIRARRRHTLALHGWGVARGLELTRQADSAIAIGPGFAIDAEGRELEIAQGFTVDLGAWGPGALLRVALAYREALEREDEDNPHLDAHVDVVVTDGPEPSGALLLGTVQLDAQGQVEPSAIDLAGVRRQRTPVSPGSIGAAALDDTLRRGWLRLPFRGLELQHGPAGESAIPPPFRLGTTEARAHSDWQGQPNKHGAGGTMAIPIPFGALRVLRLRLAGVENDDRIDFHLVRGGFDPDSRQHVRTILLEKTITGRPYNEVWRIDDGELDPEYHTLALWLRCHGMATVSLAALEFSY